MVRWYSKMFWWLWSFTATMGSSSMSSSCIRKYMSTFVWWWSKSWRCSWIRIAKLLSHEWWTAKFVWNFDCVKVSADCHYISFCCPYSLCCFAVGYLPLRLSKSDYSSRNVADWTSTITMFCTFPTLHRSKSFINMMNRLFYFKYLLIRISFSFKRFLSSHLFLSKI